MNINLDFLKKDKYKLLEGICVENQFKKSFTFQMSEGWWCVPNNYERSRFIFFYLLLPNEEINLITLKVFEHLLLRKQTIYLAKYNGDFHFKKIKNIADLETNDYFDINTLMKKENINNKYKNFQASDSTTDTYKTQRVIQYFIDEQIIEKIYIERLFANHILSGFLNTMPINLDAIMFRNNRLVILEIKFKYPSKEKTFGINIGQAKILKYLIDLNFKAFHYIALNPSYNESIGIFEIQHDSYLKNNLYWYYKELTALDFETTYSVAPSKTSIDGNKKQKFIEIESSAFQIQQVLQKPLEVEFLKKHYDLSSCSKCGGKQKVVNLNNKYFIGCVNYRDCK